MNGDLDLYMLHYYLHKGITFDKILSASEMEKSFYKASMLVTLENEAERNS